ncbi:MAG: hypothetical protein QNL91_14665 [Candidatus Krumholzibacteria bacterium]|nr:hypothetical protein [Candidatus Krumholzibacteria bacterium]
MAVVLVFVTGCSGYRAAVVPGFSDPTLPAGPDSPVVEVGMDVRVLLRSGVVHKGEVLGLDGKTLVLGKVGNYGFEETEILFVDINKVEVESASEMASAGVRTVGTTMVVLAGFITLVFLAAVANGGLY